jgi:hypothetical protein
MLLVSEESGWIDAPRHRVRPRSQARAHAGHRHASSRRRGDRGVVRPPGPRRPVPLATQRYCLMFRNSN